MKHKQRITRNFTDIVISSLEWETHAIQKIPGLKESLEEEKDMTKYNDIVFTMKRNKSKGSYGYSYEFIKPCWEYINISMLNAFRQYLEEDTLPEQCRLEIITYLSKHEKDGSYMTLMGSISQIQNVKGILVLLDFFKKHLIL